LALIGLALLLSAVRNARAQHSKQPSEKHERSAGIQTHDTKDQQEQVPLAAFESSQSALLEAIRTIKAQSDAKAEKDRAEASGWIPRLTSMDVQQGLLVVGALYTFFALLQWAAIRRQANIAEKVLIFAERPEIDVLITEVLVGSKMFGDGRYIPSCLTIKYKFINSGRTPAFIIEMNAGIHYSDSPIPPPEPSYEPAPSFWPRRTTVASGRTHFAEVYRSFSQLPTHFAERKIFAHLFVFARYIGRLTKPKEQPYSTKLSGIVAFESPWKAHIEFPSTHTYNENT
jgi:hypothetical protein